jgi:hypothetical protein
MSISGTAWATLIVVLSGSGLAAAGSQRPDLVESAVSVSQHGPTLQVTDVARNRGETTAAASVTGYYLARVRIGGRPVGRLGPASASRGSRQIRIPSSVPRGSWRLLACADVGARIHESNERNNCRPALQHVQVGDLVPPAFAGLMRATTCIPGPVGGPVRYSRYSLRWDHATDNLTPTSEIVYLVYEANVAGGEDFSTPTYTAPPGATSFVTPLLPSDLSHYFVVRAIDRAGNRDANRGERLGTNLCV